MRLAKERIFQTGGVSTGRVCYQCGYPVEFLHRHNADSNITEFDTADLYTFDCDTIDCATINYVDSNINTSNIYYFNSADCEAL